MKVFNNLIISASAGTGKTYRLSLEYIGLILRYYEHPDFSLDSILAITFTRKASYEIRERILEQLESLEKGADEDLAANLNQILGRDTKELSIRESNILGSARREILADKRKLQVGTIDSYISHIFRNIVRPLRSIDNYDIDLSAIDKRMPYLLKHLMKPEIRQRIDKLLQRKVRRTLDDYADFFSSMIENRWLYYMIKMRCVTDGYPLASGHELADFELACKDYAHLIEEIAQAKNIGFLDCLKTAGKRLFPQDTIDADSFVKNNLEMLKTAVDASRLLKYYAGEAIYLTGKVGKGEIQDTLNEAQKRILKTLADHLYYRYLLPEQEEILELWDIILKEYDRLIYRYKNMTYDDISWFSFEALFSDDPPSFDLSNTDGATEFYHFLSYRTRFLLIDEFQDTSLLQFNILKPIMEELCAGIGAKDIGGIIVVGDEKQSIFGWRGGERDLLLNLKHMIPSLAGASEAELDTSWRSSEEIIDFINKVFLNRDIHRYLGQRGLKWEYRQAQSGLGSLPGELELKIARYSRTSEDLGSIDDVYRDFVQNMILPAIQKNPKEQIAILCRTKAQLSELQLILEEHDERGVFQPSAPIAEHLLVSALIAWLRFAYYRDWYYLLVFLRSDFLHLGSAELKHSIDAISLYQKQLKDGKYEQMPDFGAESYLKDWLELAEKHREQSPYAALREILAIVGNEEILKEPRDQLNLDAFLGIVKNWELNEATQGAKIPDLLDYLEDNEKQEGFKQAGVEGEERLQLLTIHKAKGLQFDRVFVFYNLRGKGGSGGKQMYHSHRYLDSINAKGEKISSLHYLDAYVLTFHHEEVLRHSKAGFLWEADENMEILEELNNLYVAFTRAKTSLHICFAYENVKQWADYFQEKENEAGKKGFLPLVSANSCLSYFEGIEAGENGNYLLEIAANAAKNEEKPVSKPKPRELLGLDSGQISRLEGLNWDKTRALEDAHLPWQELYLKRPQFLYGDLAHYYLSFIKRDSAEEHAQARLSCTNRYGTLIKETTLNRLYDSIQAELNKYSYLFDQDFDLTFTELEIGDMRVDRLMVNSAKKEAWLIDYKTGGIHEKEQLDRYQQALQSLPAFAGYRFLKPEYILLNLDI